MADRGRINGSSTPSEADLSSVPEMTRRAPLCIWVAFAVILPLFMAALLIGPRASAEDQANHCIANVASDTIFGLSVNCDAFQLVDLARNPHKLLERDNWRQSRPMLVMPAALLRPLFLWTEDVPKRFNIRPAADMRDYFQRFMPEFLGFGFPSFAAYALVNTLTLMAVFAVFLWLVLGSPFGGWNIGLPAAFVVAAFGGLLIANDVVKAFAWTPHTQLYNILVPLLAVAALAKPPRGHWRIVLVGIGCGLGVLAYPLFLLVPACLVLRALIEARNKGDRTALRSAAFVAAITVALSLAWIGFVLWYVGSFFSDTMHYRQVIWPVDSFAKGTLFSDLAEKFGYMMSRAGHQMSALVLAFVPIAAAFWMKRQRPVMSQADFELCIAALAMPLLVLAFNLVVGNNVARIAYGMVAPLIVVGAVLARIALEAERERLARLTAATCIAIVLAEFVHVAVKAGPYS